MPFAYSAFGLSLESTCPIPGLRLLTEEKLPDIRVSFDGLPDLVEDQVSPSSAPWYSSANPADGGVPGLEVWRLEGAMTWLRYRDGTQFVVDRKGTRIWVSRPPTVTLDDVFVYLLGPVLGLVSRLRGTVCFHASAIVLNGHAVCIIGQSRAGKSTTAAALAKRGCPVLSEDSVPVVKCRDSYVAHPGYSHIRLWPDAAHLLFGNEDELPRLAPPWDKRFLDLTREGFSFQSEPAPLSSIYVLSARSDKPEAPFVDGLSPKFGLLALLSNSYASHLLDTDQRAAEFEFMSRLAASVPIRRIVPHLDASRLDMLCDAILADHAQFEVPIAEAVSPHNEVASVQHR